jgi:hypothetical protein
VDTHIDIVAWGEKPTLRPLEEIIGSLTHVLEEQRVGAELRSSGERRDHRGGVAHSYPPIGLLTHHRVFDAGDWDDLAELFSSVTAVPGLEWADPSQLFRSEFLAR